LRLFPSEEDHLDHRSVSDEPTVAGSLPGEIIMRTVLISIAHQWVTAPVVVLPMLATTAHGQSARAIEDYRNRQENQAVLSVQGERMRARRQTQAQRAVQAKVDVAAAQARKFKKYVPADTSRRNENARRRRWGNWFRY
jgi:hypothetical protein